MAEPPTSSDRIWDGARRLFQQAPPDVAARTQKLPLEWFGLWCCLAGIELTRHLQAHQPLAYCIDAYGAVCHRYGAC